MKDITKYRLCGLMYAGSTSKLIYLLLLDIAGMDHKVIITQKRISEMLGVSKKTVTKNLQKLRDEGYIDIYPKYNEYYGRIANEYVII